MEQSRSLKALIIGAMTAVGRLRNYFSQKIGPKLLCQVESHYHHGRCLIVLNYVYQEIRIIEVGSVDFLEELCKWKFNNINTLFYCLGSQSQEEALFEKHDYDYPIKAVEMAVNNNIPHFSIVSVAGADRNSKVKFLQMKGQCEEQIAQRCRITSIHRAVSISEPAEYSWIMKYLCCCFCNMVIHTHDKKSNTMRACQVAKALRIEAEFVSRNLPETNRTLIHSVSQILDFSYKQ